MKFRSGMNKSRRCSRQAGFTLLEIILVLGIFGSVAAVILPNIGLTIGSRMSMALRELSGTLRATYDNAVLSGRINRLVLNLKTSEYWVEAAPPGFNGRPSAQSIDRSASEQRLEDSRARLLEELERAASEVRKAGGGNSERSYSVRSILVAQRGSLKEAKWTEIEDAILTRRRLPTGLLFWSVATEGMQRAASFTELRDGETAFIYFFPWGEAIRAQIQLASQLPEGGGLDERSPKNTLALDSLSGRSSILEGLQEAEFIRER
ncbi:MAG: type II secretion system protein [Betaproteobacteria bacterium]|nr:type II secretion system protein [Betaproteobacteria bacterium]